LEDERDTSAASDYNAITQAFVEHKRVLAAYLARFFLRSEDVEDIMQETVMKTLEASDRKSIASPKAYLFITARNMVYKKLKRQSKTITKEITEIEEATIEAKQVTQYEQLHNKQKMDAFLKACETLPPQCRRVFLMRKFYGKSQKEISKELGISTSTVERHITNAIKQCRTMMETQGFSVDYISRAPKAKKNTGD
jgi:RNA polymerase sigma-70 factor (ECF subfamily)